MNNFQKMFVTLSVIVLISIGVLIGLFLSAQAHKDYYQVPKSQTKGIYIQLENGTLWKKQ